MTKSMSAALYVAAMMVAIVGVEFLFFKNRFWERLVANVLIVRVLAPLRSEPPPLNTIADGIGRDIPAFVR